MPPVLIPIEEPAVLPEEEPDMEFYPAEEIFPDEWVLPNLLVGVSKKWISPNNTVLRIIGTEDCFVYYDGSKENNKYPTTRDEFIQHPRTSWLCPDNKRYCLGYDSTIGIFFEVCVDKVEEVPR